MSKKTIEQIRAELDELNAIMAKNANVSDQLLLALSESQKKRKKRFQDPDVKQKKHNSLKKSWADPETYIKRTIINSESRTEEVRKKISKGLIGIKRNPITEDHKQKLSDALKGIPKPKYICPICGKEGAGPIMKRFHFNNCKHK